MILHRLTQQTIKNICVCFAEKRLDLAAVVAVRVYQFYSRLDIFLFFIIRNTVALADHLFFTAKTTLLTVMKSCVCVEFSSIHISNRINRRKKYAVLNILRHLEYFPSVLTENHLQQNRQ